MRLSSLVERPSSPLGPTCWCSGPAARAPGDPACKDIPSLDIVAKAVSLIRERGGRIVNVDSSLIAESPRISPYLEQMKGALGTALGISPVRVGIKATTNEQLGALGRREGIAAFAVAAILMPEDLAMP